MPVATNLGLTTGQAPFIEEARSHGELYIEQPYELYTDENHAAWRRLVLAHAAALGAVRERAFSRRGRIAVPESGSRAAAGGCEPVSLAAHWISRKGRQRVRPGIPVFRLPAESRVPHHHHHPPQRSPRLSARARHLPRHRRPCADAHRSGIRRYAGALRRVRAHRRGPGRRRFATRRLGCTRSPASSKPWRDSSGSRSSSA